jgi:hypothetical protein
MSTQRTERVPRAFGFLGFIRSGNCMVPAAAVGGIGRARSAERAAAE